MFIKIDWERLNRFLKEAAEASNEKIPQKVEKYIQLYFLENTNIQIEEEVEENDK